MTKDKHMKYLFLVSILLTVSISTFGQNEEISEIRRLYKETQDNKNNYKRLSQDDFENSSEGGEVTAYKNSEEVKLIEAVYYGHMGKAKYEYYYKASKVYFVFIEEFNYNAPPTQPSYDQEKTTKEESRYYFWNDEMIRWIKPSGEYSDPVSTAFQEEAAKILKWASETVEMVK